MIAKFNTSASGTSSKGSMNTLVVLAIIGVAGYFGYRYFTRNKDEENKQ